MPKPFWKFQNVAGDRAELLLYGDISDSTWWGDEVTPKQFAEDLDKLGAVSEITVRINSGGGDVFAAQTIGNLLEQHPANVVAFQVPTEIRPDRKESISMKNLIAFARKRGGKTMADKLAAEIMDAYNNQGGAYKRKEDMHRMAEANRAFAHFRF